MQILTPEYAKVMSEELAAVERGGIRQGVSAKVLYYVAHDASVLRPLEPI